MSDVAAFASLFRGRTDASGSVEGRSLKEPVVAENYRLHLEGKKSLGVYPLLDDGTCYFAAVDLDVKDWKQALAIRNELGDVGVPAYIAESKGKGFHIYLFGEPFVARDVRYLLLGVLRKLKVSAEVFPKQDRLDEVITLGNYINLPCFGPSRQFQTTEHKPIQTTSALGLIQKTPAAAVTEANKKVPAPRPAILPSSTPTSKKGKPQGRIKSPPCVEKLLKGVDTGLRDEAAFALARHYLDQGEDAGEVLARLLIWDAKNKPPLGDMRILQTKVRSAEHGYAFGCNSVQSGLLSPACVGEANCEFLKRQVKEKKKEGLIVERASYEDDDALYEEVVTVGRAYEVTNARFLRYDKKSGALSEIKEIVEGERAIWPIISEEIGYKAVTLPSGIEEYGETTDLVKELKAHISKYTDLPENFLEFSAWYVLMSWVYARLPSMCYLRFLGDWGCGKSRSLDVIGGLCYKRIRVGGALTTAPLFRMMKKYEGCLIIDEADFDKSDTTHELVKILNSGIEKGTPIMRCTQDNPDIMQVFPCFGPKAFATRRRFHDDALESRCLTVVMEESDRDDIPPYLAKEHNEAQHHLHNKLLLFRFRNMTRIPEEISEVTDIDLGPIESRLKQVCIPFAMVFQDLPETLDAFRRFLRGYSKELRSARTDSVQGRVIYGFFKAAVAMGRDATTVGAIAKTCADELKLDIKENTVSRILHDMKITTERKRVGGGRVVLVKWDNRLMIKLYRRYLNDLTPTPEEDSEENQFLEMLEFPKKP